MTSEPRLNAASIASLPPTLREKFLKNLETAELRFLLHDWLFWARPDQLPPPGAAWTTWLILGGRGAGKTRAGAEWVRHMAETGAAGRIALVGETMSDAREVMVEGVSGLLAIAPRETRPRYEPSRKRLVWPNGAVATCFSAEDPDGLRGPQFSAAWSDEVAKWRYGEAAWSNLQLALRLGDRPCQVATTTPRPVPLLKTLLKQKTTAVSRASTFANQANLAPTFLTEIVGAYEGTRLGRQELDGEMLEDTPGALWTLAELDGARVEAPPETLDRIVVAVDPPVTAHAGSDACGIIVAALSEERGYVLADKTLERARPAEWAAAAVSAYRAFEADRIVVEVNQGGDLVEDVLRQTDASVAVRPVRASRGKRLRAEPVAALYEQGRVSHAGVFAKLEDEMVSYTGRGGEKSPDRMDALVWALTELMLGGPMRQPGVRRF